MPPTLPPPADLDPQLAYILDLAKKILGAVAPSKFVVPPPQDTQTTLTAITETLTKVLGVVNA